MQPISTQAALKVLLIESDPDKAGRYSDCLRRLGYSVQMANDGDVELLTEASWKFCALVVPFQVARREEWRKAIERTLSADDDIPVVILAKEGSGSELVDSLARGASDFLVEPFGIEEFATRLALLVQSRGRRSKDILRYADISMDRAAHAVTVSGRWMAVTRREYSILERLLLRPESVVTRPELLRSVWVPYSRSVFRLRSKGRPSRRHRIPAPQLQRGKHPLRYRQRRSAGLLGRSPGIATGPDERGGGAMKCRRLRARM